MGYNSIYLIEQMFKQDKSRLGDKNKLFDYLFTLKDSFAGPLKFGDNTLYDGRIASILLVGVDISGGKLTPQIFDVNVQKFINAAKQSGRFEGCSNADTFFSEKYPLSSGYKERRSIPGLNLSYAELATTNPMISSDRGIMYGGAMASPDFLRKPSDQQYWHWVDEQYAGYNDSAVANAYNSNGVTELTYLFYTLAIIDELQSRYGYRTPDPTRPYSPYNWVKSSDNGVASNACRYYKILYLTEFDCMVHAGAINNPNLLTTNFVTSPIFSKMIDSMTSYSTDMTLVNDPTNASSPNYLNRIHSTILKQNDILIAGQYIYSKDFKYKLMLRCIGTLSVFELPVTLGGLNTPHVSVLGENTWNSWTRSKDNFVGCYLSLQADKNVVIYCNPVINVAYDKPGIPVTFSGAQKPIEAINTADNTVALQSSSYSLLIIPGGPLVVASPGINEGSNNASYITGSDKANWAYPSGPLDLDCINGWSYKRIDKSAVEPSIVSTTTREDTKPWCYVSWLIKPSKYNPTTNLMEFDDAVLQTIFYTKGTEKLPNNQVYDVAYNLITGDFMKKAITLGFGLNTATNNKIKFAYCMRGDRWATADDCNKSLNSLINANDGWKSAADYKLTKLICAGNYDAKYDTTCAIIAPKVSMTKSLVQIDPMFGVLNPSKTDNSYNPYGNVVIGDIMIKYSTFTVDQLDFLYRYLTTDTHLITWRKLYATATGLTAFNPPSFTNHQYKQIYESPWIKACASAIIAFKTSAGMYISKGEWDFPYVTSSTSYTASDPLWKRILISSTSTAPKSIWAGPSFVKITLDDVKAFAPSDWYTIIQSVYDPIEITITGLAQPANAFVFIKSLNADKLITFLQKVATTTEKNILSTTSICAVTPDACYSDIYAYIKNNPFDTTSNKYCDIASSTITRDTNLSYFSKANATALKDICNTSYSLINCSLPTKRYAKSTFKNRSIIPSSRMNHERFDHMRENYSGSISCLDVCATAAQGTPMYDACKAGSIAYCSTGNNVASDLCVNDAVKYPEINNILTKWCTTSSAAVGSKYCPIPQTVTQVQQAPLTEIITTPTPISGAASTSTITSTPVITPVATPVATPIATTPSATPVITTNSITPIATTTGTTDTQTIVYLIDSRTQGLIYAPNSIDPSISISGITRSGNDFKGTVIAPKKYKYSLTFNKPSSVYVGDPIDTIDGNVQWNIQYTRPMIDIVITLDSNNQIIWPPLFLNANPIVTSTTSDTTITKIVQLSGETAAAFRLATINNDITIENIIENDPDSRRWIIRYPNVVQLQQATQMQTQTQTQVAQQQQVAQQEAQQGSEPKQMQDVALQNATTTSDDKLLPMDIVALIICGIALLLIISTFAYPLFSKSSNTHKPNIMNRFRQRFPYIFQQYK